MALRGGADRVGDDAGVVFHGAVFGDGNQAVGNAPALEEATLSTEVGVGLGAVGDVEPARNHQDEEVAGKDGPRTVDARATDVSQLRLVALA